MTFLAAMFYTLFGEIVADDGGDLFGVPLIVAVLVVLGILALLIWIIRALR